MGDFQKWSYPQDRWMVFVRGNPIYKCMLAAGVAPFDDHDFLSKPLVTTGDLPEETPMKPPWAEKKKWAPARW